MTLRLAGLLSLLALALAAADVSGAWRGTISTPMAAETTGGEIPAYMTLEQSGSRVTGSAGGSEKMLFRIQEGRIEGDRLTVEASPKEGVVLRFTLVVKGDALEGSVEENGRRIGTAKLTKER
jgi:hypothetical protein